MNIAAYIAAENPQAAERHIRYLLSKCLLLAEFPGMGRQRSELSSGLRGFPVDNYIIFYRETDFGIEVIRVLSGFRDIPVLFEPE